MNYTVVVLSGGFTISLVWYYFPGVHWFTGPIQNTDRSGESDSPKADAE